MRRSFSPPAELLNAVLIAAGALSAGMGLVGFLKSSRFIDGGVTGVSMLLAKETPLPLPFWLLVVNLPFVALGWRQLGRAFAVRGVAAIAALSLAVEFIPFPDVTPDPLLTAVFGGFFIGLGVGLAVRGGAVLDGTEIAAVLIAKRTPLLKVGDVVLAFNIALFLVAMTLLGVEPALYSILTYIAAAKTLDFVVYGLEQHTAFTIISRESRSVRDALTREVARGVTVFKATGGRSGEEQDVLYCVVPRLEVGKVRALVRALDPKAFIVHHPLAGAEGSLLKKPSLD